MTSTRSWRARVLLSSALAVLALCGSSQQVVAGMQAGQDQTAQEEPPEERTPEEREAIAQAEEEGFVRLAEEVSVTGSLIPRKDLESLSPVAIVNPEEVTYQGTARMEDLIQALPQALRLAELDRSPTVRRVRRRWTCVSWARSAR